MMRTLGLCAVVAALILVSTGCARTTQEHQFDPIPEPQMGAQDLTPIQPPSTTDLLNRANEAFQSANKAQESGDYEAALRDYKLMLELLIDADLDPSVLYSLRTQFERILDTGTEYAKLFDRERGREWDGVLPPASGNLEVPFPIPQRVIAEIEEIQKAYSRNFQAGLNRSTKYTPYIRQELAKAGLPQDLVWLAMVESQFHPRVVSHAGAGGMWQFMRATGRRYNLRIDEYVDERYDWQKATRAAIAYLTDLRDMFDGNWPLAVSAYNMGEGGVERAIAAAGGEENIWMLLDSASAANRIPRETKKFYPKLLASVIVARSPDKYGFTVTKQAPDRVARVPVKGCYALASLDSASGLPSGTLRELNPDLVRGVTPPHGEYAVAVPADANTKFLTALKDVPKVSVGSHVVRRGDTLSGIASRYNVSVNSIMRTNNIRSAHRIQVGKRLTIPGAVSSSSASRPSVSSPKVSGSTYRVKRGDSLGSIAKATGASVSDLQAWNKMGRRTTIHAGQTLKIQSPSKQSTPTPSGTKATHLVKAGECPGTIASHYGVGLSDFLKWNGLTKKSQIRVGQKLVVYDPKRGGKPAEPVAVAQVEKVISTPPEASTPVPAVKKHKAKSGESAWTIAKKYGVSLDDFLRWNGLTKKSYVQVGKEYVVSGPASGNDKSSASSGEKITHMVQKGQNPSTIAKRYGVLLSDLRTWNGWGKSPVLHIGDKVVVYKK